MVISSIKKGPFHVEIEIISNSTYILSSIEAMHMVKKPLENVIKHSYNLSG